MAIIFNGMGQGQETSSDYTEETSVISATAKSANQLADINSLMAASSQLTGRGGSQPDTPDPSMVQGNSIIENNPAEADYIDSFKPDQVIKYSVQSGDSIGSIAYDFGVSANTIIWANDIKNPNTLSIGQTLRIPPVNGVIHTVQAGDTVESIAKKYKAGSNEILTFNNLQDNQNLEIGNELMIPGGELPGPRPYVRSVARGSSIYVPVGDGQCVAFVQAHGFSGLHGNAWRWKYFSNIDFPVAGGVVVLKGGRYGHVALITAVKADSIQLVEQNYYGPYIIDHREISLKDSGIIAFIR